MVNGVGYGGARNCDEAPLVDNWPLASRGSILVMHLHLKVVCEIRTPVDDAMTLLGQHKYRPSGNAINLGHMNKITSPTVAQKPLPTAKDKNGAPKTSANKTESRPSHPFQVLLSFTPRSHLQKQSFASEPLLAVVSLVLLLSSRLALSLLRPRHLSCP